MSHTLQRQAPQGLVQQIVHGEKYLEPLGTSTLHSSVSWDNFESWVHRFDEGKIFVKSLPSEEKALSECRSLGLLRKVVLQSAADIQVPLPLGVISHKGRHLFFMEYVPFGGAPNPHLFGRELGVLHKYRGSELFGLPWNNTIGMGTQYNNPTPQFVPFFREYRLKPQLAWAKEGGLLKQHTLQRITWLIDYLDDYLTEPEDPSFLHGDLWGGNHIYPESGGVALIDPAPYWGHREADLAFTELFGGFSLDFYRGYQESYPLQKGYNQRKYVYNLYHALNHLNLFGSSYRSMVEGVLTEIGRFKSFDR